MRDPVIALVADLRTSYENGGDVELLLERIGDVGPISFGGIRALVGFLRDVGEALAIDHPEAVSEALTETEDALAALIEAQRIFDTAMGRLQ